RRERLPLNRAAGRVVFRIDVHDEPLTFEVIERDGLAVLVFEIEIYEAFTFLKSHDSPPLLFVRALCQPDLICTWWRSCDRSVRYKPNSAARRRSPDQTIAFRGLKIFPGCRSPATGVRFGRARRPTCVRP